MKVLFASLLCFTIILSSCSNQEGEAQQALCDCIIESAKTDKMTTDEILDLYEKYFKKRHNVDGTSQGYIRLMADTLRNPGGPWGGIDYPNIEGNFVTERDSTFACIDKVKTTFSDIDSEGAAHYTLAYFDAVRNFESVTYKDILVPLQKVAELEDPEIQLARHIFLLTLSPAVAMDLPSGYEGAP